MIFTAFAIAGALLASLIIGLFLGAGFWAAATKSSEAAFAAGQKESLAELKAMRASLDTCARDASADLACDDGDCCCGERYEPAAEIDEFDDDEGDGEEWKRK